MRTIHDHKVNGLNEAIQILATDAPGPGGANHDYLLTVDNRALGSPDDVISTRIMFQNGPINEAGFNGLSNEALLAVLIDRMRGFQHCRTYSILVDGVEKNLPIEPPVPNAQDTGFDFNTRGKYACRENACALTHLEEAMMWLQKRTRDRMARGVEGTHKV